MYSHKRTNWSHFDVLVWYQIYMETRIRTKFQGLWTMLFLAVPLSISIVMPHFANSSSTMHSKTDTYFGTNQHIPWTWTLNITKSKSGNVEHST